MSDPPKVTPQQRNVGNVVAEFMLRVARPFYWHSGPRIGIRGMVGGSVFILRFKHRVVAVTANHVLQAYLDAKAANPALICQISNGQVWPEDNIISQSASLDIATFSVSEVQVPTFGGNTLDCTGDWPPPDVVVGDGLSIVGYPENLRIEREPGHMDFPAWGALGVVDAVTDREIVSVYDPATGVVPDWAPEGMPQLGQNLSGSSGGPVILHKVVNGVQRFFPVGLILRGPTGIAPGEAVTGDRSPLGALADFDRIHIRRLHYIQQDGTITEQDTGWLPNSAL